MLPLKFFCRLLLCMPLFCIHFFVLPYIDAEIELPEGILSIAEDDCASPLETELSAVVNNRVNVITGLYHDFDIDCALPGNAALSLQRAYVSTKTHRRGPLGRGWCHNYFGIARAEKDKLIVMESCGSCIHFKANKDKTFGIDPDSIKYGVTNCGSGQISARTHVKNNKWTHDTLSKSCLFEKASGVKQTYLKHGKYNDHWKHYWQVDREKLPNGNSREYSYDDKCRVSAIESLSSSGKFLEKLVFTYAKAENGNPLIYIASSHEHLVRYQFAKLKESDGDSAPYLYEVIRERAPPIYYCYDTGAHPIKLRKKYGPENRFEEIEYYKHDKTDKDRKLKPEKVKCLKGPVGVDAQPIVTHRFEYLAAKLDNGGYALVYDALGHKTRYSWGESQRLRGVIRYLGNEESVHDYYSLEELKWSDGGINLTSRSLLDNNYDMICERSYVYDRMNNVRVENLWGNITGQHPNVSRPNSIDLLYECLQTKYTYTEDGRNLLTSETQGDSRIRYAYLEGRDLITSKLYINITVSEKDISNERIYKREFYEYDDSGMIIKEICDDGTHELSDDLTGVTERKIKNYHRNHETPFGLPECIDEAYLAADRTTDALYSKTVNTYCSQGRLLQSACYDADGTYLYTLHWEYDHMGNIIRETDPLGLTTERRYDANGNKVYEQGPNKAFYTEYTYDFSNRLIRLAEVHEDGVVLTETFKYNYLSQKISSTDIYENETHYIYDALGRLVETILPITYDWDGNPTATSQKRAYDVLNHVSSITDGCGNSTRYECTV